MGIRHSSRRSVKALLIDLSGTIHIENQVIDGAVEAIQTLKSRNIPHLFVSNTSKESQRLLVERLNGIGFNIATEEIFTSLSSAKSAIVSRKLNPMLILEEDAMEDFTDLKVKGMHQDSVLVGLAPEMFDYDTLTEAFNLLKDTGGPLIAVNKARYFGSSTGLKLGAGFFVSGLEYSLGIKAEVLGKPEESFFMAALDHLNKLYRTNVIKEETVMVGDDVKDDVVGAQKSGFQGCLVQTGKYRDGDEDSMPGRKPDYVYPSLAAFVSVV